MSFEKIEIKNKHAAASISLYGGQVLSYTPHGDKDLLWLSKKAIYKNGKAIRGGIPICWPWFGPKNEMPSHGFARIMPWEFQEKMELDDGSTQIVLCLENNEETEKYWPYHFKLQLNIIIGKTLKLKLTTINQDHRPIKFTEALHSYFRISHIQNIRITGLDTHAYIDQLQKVTTTQKGDIEFNQEVDRIYHQQGNTQVIDSGMDRVISVRKKNSRSTIVWNPWIDKSSRMQDVDENNYKKFVCVESGNVSDHHIQLETGQSHTLTLEISL